MALIVSWFVAVLFAPLLGVADPEAAQAEQSAEPGRVFGSIAVFCRGYARAMADDRAHARALRRLLPGDAARSRASSSRPRTGPNCWSISACRRTPRSMPARTSLSGFDAAPQGRSRCRALEHLCRPRRDPLLPAARCPAAEQFLRPGGDRGQGRARRANGCRSSWRSCSRTIFPSVVGRVSPLELGPPVGWPIQYRISGPDIAQVREIALELAATVARNPQTIRRQLRLDRAGSPGAHPDRSG